MKIKLIFLYIYKKTDQDAGTPFSVETDIDGLCFEATSGGLRAVFKEIPLQLQPEEFNFATDSIRFSFSLSNVDVYSIGAEAVVGIALMIEGYYIYIIILCSFCMLLKEKK